MTTAEEQLQAQCVAWGVDLDNHKLALLEKYGDLLGGYELANVIGTRDRSRILLDHLLDSLSCLSFKGVEWTGALVDAGTGGGLPGIPLSIACPGLQVTLLETTEKKVRFLEHAKAELDLDNIRVLHTRLEDTGREPTSREAFDIATARALASLPVVVEYCAPLVRFGGVVLAMKAGLEEEELAQGTVASRKLGAELREVFQVHHLRGLPQKERRLVVFDKVRVTPTGYPRRVGLVKKRPLGT